MFRITWHKGFHVEFPNGVTVSVQFGGGNYCDNYDMDIGNEKKINMLESSDAEVAAFISKTDEWILGEFDKKSDGMVAGNYGPMRVLELLNWASKYKPSGRGYKPKQNWEEFKKIMEGDSNE